MHAEAPQAPSKKPIYDDSPSPPTTTPTKASLPTQSPMSSIFSGLTPTDQLAAQIRRARLFLHGHAAAGEEMLNTYLTSALDLESSFTGTIASLAPPASSNERILPGAMYVLVAAMAGSIVTRNRNILLRATVPLALGVGAGLVVLPLTMRNVGDLVWKFEERVPVISNNHMRIRGAAEEAWKMARERGDQTLKVVDDKVHEGREAVEGWVKRGR